MSVFVDTGVLFAAAATADDRHEDATALLDAVASERPFTTDHVLVESWSLLRSRAGWDSAMRFWHGVRATPLTVESVTLADLERARGIADAWRDQQLDLVGCTSFAVIERLGCSRVTTFDRDFAVYRYGPYRRRALEIVRVP